MKDREFINWLRSYIKTARDTKDNILIASMLSTVEEDVQTNPYWSSISTTLTDNSELNYSVVVDPKTNSFSVVNYQEDENRKI